MSNVKRIGKISAEDRRRFWAFVEKSIDDCWRWKGGLRNGYGKFAMPRGKKLYAHRVSYYIAYGIDPGEKQVLHRCDNPPCVNPSHLFLGTQADNVRDMIQKGRNSAGITRTNAKLSEAKVQEIHALHAQGWGYKRLARRFGVSRSTMRLAVIGATWSHVVK